MADKTTQKDGNWSDTSLWNGGSLPSNNQTIQISHNVVYDVDTSGWANGHGAITIDAGKSITACTTAGTYYMKMAGTITGTGAGAELRAGSAGTEYPSGCKFTLYLNGNFSIDGGSSNYLTVKFYAKEPSVRIVRLASTAPKAITGITQASPGVFTCAAHGYNVSDTIWLLNIGGMKEINNCRFIIKTKDTDWFTLRYYDEDVAVDTTLFTAYTSGGYACPSTAEASSQTQLEVDTDVSSDTEWSRTNATVQVDGVSRARDTEARTISSLGSSTITVTSGLSAGKPSTSIVTLKTRNVTIQSSATAITNGMIYRGSGHYVRAELLAGNSSNYGMNAVADSEFAGTAYGMTQPIYNCDRVTISGATAGTSYATDNCRGLVLSGNHVGHAVMIRNSVNIVIDDAALVQGCDAIFERCTSAVIRGTVRGNGSQCFTYSDIVLTHALIHNMTTVFYRCAIRADSATFVATQYDYQECHRVFEQNCLHTTTYGTQKVNYLYDRLHQSAIAECHDYQKVAGGFKAWTKGGMVVDSTSNPPTGQTRSYLHTTASAAYPCWRHWLIWVEPGRTLRLRVWLKADVGVEIKAQLVLPTADPLITGTGTGEWQQVGTSDTDWHEYITSWTNSATYPVLIEARALATAASGNGYSQIQYAFDRSPLRR